jgi:hypothetical protein
MKNQFGGERFSGLEKQLNAVDRLTAILNRLHLNRFYLIDYKYFQ